jgi:tryptophanyl-tRNA synthetase
MKKEVHDWCVNATAGCTECKKRLASSLLDTLAPIHKRRQEFTKDKAIVKKILEEGKEKAMAVAEKTIREAKEAMEIL